MPKNSIKIRIKIYLSYMGTVFNKLGILVTSIYLYIVKKLSKNKKVLNENESFMLMEDGNISLTEDNNPTII